MIWIPIIIPILLAIAALIYFRKKVAFWEPAIPIAVTLLFIVFFRYIGITSLTKDTEYWGNYVTEVRWYQEWDHWHVQTCSRQVPCGRDSKGNTTYCTEYYDCSHRDYYPEYWEMILNDGNNITISETYYNYLRNKFGSKDIFVDMNRDYYTIDGDMYKTLYPNTYDAFEFYASKHTYKNKVQASTSIFNYPKVTKEDITRYKLYDYPNIKDDKLSAILTPNSIKISSLEQKKFDYINGILGMTKKIRVWVCLYNYKTDKAGFMQEALWKRGNKNEFVICIGVDKDKNINWVHIFGWSKKKIIDIETRDFIYAQKKLDLMKLGDWLFVEIKDKWIKTSFDEFEYLSIEPPFWAILTTWIVAFVSCILLYWWILVNKFTSTDYNGDGYDEINENDDSKIKKFFNKIKKLFVK